MYEDEIIEQMGTAIEAKMQTCNSTNDFEKAQSILAPLPSLPAKPVERKLYPKEKERLMDNLRIEDVVRSAHEKRLDSFLMAERTNVMNPVAEDLLNDLRRKALSFKGFDPQIYQLRRHAGYSG